MATAADTAALLARLKQKKAQYSRSTGKTIKPKEGKTRIRIFIAPKLVTEDHIFGERDLGVHWIKTQTGGKPVAVVGDQELVYGKPSLINPAIKAATDAATDDETLALIKDWAARKSVLINAVIRDGADASTEPQILELTPTTFGEILSIYETYIADGIEDVLDPNTGIDILIERQGKGLDTKYSVMVPPKSTPLNKGTVEKAQDLDAFIASEYFRGEESKAINAISAMMGISLTALPGGRTSALLTAAKPVAPVEAAKVEPKVIEAVAIGTVAAAVVAAAAAGKAAADDKAAKIAKLRAAAAAKAKADEAALEAQIEAETQALLIAEAKTEVATASVTGDKFDEAIGEDELDKMLADLEV